HQPQKTKTRAKGRVFAERFNRGPARVGRIQVGSEVLPKQSSAQVRLASQSNAAQDKPSPTPSSNPALDDFCAPVPLPQNQSPDEHEAKISAYAKFPIRSTNSRVGSNWIQGSANCRQAKLG